MSIDWDKPLQTIEGFDVVLLTKDFMYAGKPVYCVMIESVCGYSRTFLYQKDGSPVTISSPSIRNKTKKVVKWINLYSKFPGSRYYDTPEAAKAVRDGTEGWADVVPVEIEVPCD